MFSSPFLYIVKERDCNVSMAFVTMLGRNEGSMLNKKDDDEFSIRIFVRNDTGKEEGDSCMYMVCTMVCIKE